MAEFGTGSHWLDNRNGIAQENATYQMCNQQILDPGLPAARFASFDPDDDADDPLRMSIMSSLPMPDRIFRIC